MIEEHGTSNAFEGSGGFRIQEIDWDLCEKNGSSFIN